jgi:hypothetical protein
VARRLLSYLFGYGGCPVWRWDRNSYALSLAAVIAFCAVVCCDVLELPELVLVAFRVAALVTSGAAAVYGLVATAALDRRGRTTAAISVAGFAVLASLPALSVVVFLMFPSAD